jgi:chitinase
LDAFKENKMQYIVNITFMKYEGRIKGQCRIRNNYNESWNQWGLNSELIRDTEPIVIKIPFDG